MEWVLNSSPLVFNQLIIIKSWQQSIITRKPQKLMKLLQNIIMPLNMKLIQGIMKPLFTKPVLPMVNS